MTHPRILIQFDSDSHASVFDSVVAVDSGVDHLLQYSNIESTNVRSLVHGAMFTRGPNELRSLGRGLHRIRFKTEVKHFLPQIVAGNHFANRFSRHLRPGRP